MGEIVRDLSPESLARANEVNLAEGLAACARTYGGEVFEAPDLFWCHAGIPLSGFNRILRARLTPETMDARIEWVIERARALRFPFLWDIDPWTQPADLGFHLVRHGFTDRGEEPAMGVALANLPSALPLPEGVTVERVKDHATLEIWARTMSAGFGSPDPAADPVIAAVTRDSFGDDAAAHYYLARMHGEPVATAGLTRAGGVAGIFAVTTIESARRRGIGAAVTMAPLLDARSDGYEVGVLQASEMGYPVYAAIGFTEQFRYHEYVWRPD
jgi:hypothetical protein